MPSRPTLEQERLRLAEHGMYRPEFEGDACGVGMVAAIDGQPSRRVVQSAIDALKAVWHRGAVDADGKTGDGAGIHVDLPLRFFDDAVLASGHRVLPNRLAVGMIFMPRVDLGAQEACRTIVESVIIEAGYTIYGWRQVPVDVSVIGQKAQATRPEIEQIMIAGPMPDEVSQDEFEKNLYLVRRRIEKRIIAAQISGFYICSLSCRSVIYKGLFLAESLSEFYPDLKDERFVSRVAIFHQRYSTNTFPQWWLAQPFRCLAHNGEINTIRGNKNWMLSHEIKMASLAFGGDSEDIKPVIPAGASDTAALDAVFEAICRSGRDAPTAKLMLVPEAWQLVDAMPQRHLDMYKYLASVMEPWDGPAALAMTDGRWAVAGVDRNALRPLRYTRTADGLLVVGSETGMVQIPESTIVAKGRLGPGQMIAVDLEEGVFYEDGAVKDRIAGEYDYASMIGEFVDIKGLPAVDEAGPAFDRAELTRRQVAAGQTLEDMELILSPMVTDAKEAVGSMGDDTPLAVISDKPRLISQFFRQNFSQVTNPPIDSLRERHVMSLKTRFGNLANILDTGETANKVLVLESPVLTNNDWARLKGHFGDLAAEIDCTFPAGGGPETLRAAITDIRFQAEQAVRAGATELFLTDEHVGPDRIAIAGVLAAAAVHTHLVRKGLRSYASVNIRSAECLDTHYYAVLIGVGATTVNAYLAEASIADRHARGLFGDMSFDQCLKNHRKAIDEGLLKIMSKMGIAVISSYRGGYNFEAVGLSRALVNDFFPGMPAKISGEGYASLHLNAKLRHDAAFDTDVATLPIGGFYRQRHGGETHAYSAQLMHTLQTAVATDSYSTYLQFSRGVRDLPPVYLRDLLEFNFPAEGVGIDQVEAITEIRKRFVTPGMSLGALSPEAHETLAIAMNRIGAKAVSGEGGEDSIRYKPYENGDNANSTIKQIASGRFGVTAEYLGACDEVEIKVAQGAKPGEGGQLPGFKVTEFIAKLRHATPGVTLISPPPHHDIYSIEDLAQLIYDLKQINPRARVCVKLVSSAGIGTVAAGVAKAHADVILVAGHVGGTGASPQTSVKYAGTPWEMGLSEVNQTLTLNGLRGRVKLRTDGGLKTGRDIVIAAILGAEEFGIGTLSLVAMGCIMVRQCHSNTCPVGVCTQDERLRQKFTGSPEKVINLMTFIAEEVREILARLGVKSLDEVIGRTELLRQVSRGAEHLDDLDLNPILAKVDADETERRFSLDTWRNAVPDSLDAQIIADAKAVFERGEKMQLAYNVRNTHRAVGTRLSSEITRIFGMSKLNDGHVQVRLRGSAGQSLGAFLCKGVTLEVFGDANDYVGKGLSGGTIVVRPLVSSPLASQDNTIIGNTVLYGATSGKLFAAGQAGERFAVRNSGAQVVVEGCGANGCEYMTGGVAVVLGKTGTNFGAGMTGGMAFVYDEDGVFEANANPDSIMWQRLSAAHWEGVLKTLVTEHHAATDSSWSGGLLEDWDRISGHFWQVVPKEMLERLPHPLDDTQVLAAAE
ncbi:glutamate synthase large subunit [Sphingomonas koreensis]|jgi:glutamate synthase (NADPH/NADH) large chain|uniref:Glutamate synthase [NADPH] large chain n=1 Tax=Sphingomonas koreensis TaxID=93064 RepID=A0A1L6J7T3_9SPHN|nr:glutamate synthase large subunit [Sphingomonas koreensis]APR52031.1 glutamate synthase subunit alpha [Sphingomonas koreensis]MDC7812388.1 glutamate synthase large subunit [Sphingomonas koreensis]RSU22835.1 glutamate synthase large subunit [Sphingomonas koreensis]RSU30691.1 glutamate synthase large subunit [Sphingomonas koreensis]RSU31786.1 glutamate synthase large subunit [Sphingomonas koreensis]